MKIYLCKDLSRLTFCLNVPWGPSNTLTLPYYSRLVPRSNCCSCENTQPPSKPHMTTYLAKPVDPVGQPRPKDLPKPTAAYAFHIHNGEKTGIAAEAVAAGAAAGKGADPPTAIT